MPHPILILAIAALIGLAIVAATVLVVWQGWLQLKLAELARPRPQPDQATSLARIELADMKERLRKLEAIAAGIDL